MPGNGEGRAQGPANNLIHRQEDPGHSSAVDAAIAYAKRGWIPVPCDGKEPLVKIRDRDTVSTVAELHLWWGVWPDAGVAILTGARSNLVVVDLDGAMGEASWARLAQSHGPFPPTMDVKTRHGRHLYFLHPGVRILTRRSEYFYPWGLDESNAEGVDVRGDGGLVVAPPSPDRTLANDLDPAPLPPRLVEPMSTRKSELATAGPGDVDLGEAQGWLTPWEPCPAVVKVLRQYPGSSRHATVARLQVMLLRLGEQGHNGTRAAWFTLRGAFVADVGATRGEPEWADLASGAPNMIASRTRPEDRGCCIRPALTLSQSRERGRA
jgi:Bifunctional DNA primase/polymerase, N-terminal